MLQILMDLRNPQRKALLEVLFALPMHDALDMQT